MTHVRASNTILALQEDVLDHLAAVRRLLAQVDEHDGTSEIAPRYSTAIEDLEVTAATVERLELRMAVVAPMKAGKSTLINAILGRDVLPSRAAAMTAAPTEVVLEPTATDVVLELPQSTVTVLDEAARTISRRLRKAPRQREELVGRYPFLKTAIDCAAAGQSGVVARAEGTDAVRDALERLNDVVRLSNIVSAGGHLVAELEDLPRVTAPAGPILRESLAEDRVGRLVIIDTPGPNESGHEDLYAQVINHQLRHAAAILVLLDFTGLNSSASANLNQAIAPVVDLWGQDRLYAIVNKVDERRKGDMDPEAILEFVRHDLGLRASTDGRVFETVARWAFSGTRLLDEMERNPTAAPQSLVAAPDVLQNMHPVRWDRELERADRDSLAEDAHELWSASGLAHVLDTVIDVLRLEAGPRCLRDALGRSRKHMRELGDDLRLRVAALDADEDKIARERRSLEDDLDRVRSLRSLTSRFNDTQRVRANLRNRVGKHLRRARDNAHKAVAIAAEGDSADEKSRSWWTRPVETLQAALGGTRDGDDAIAFSDNGKATEFADGILAAARRGLSGVLEEARRDVERELKEGCRELTKDIEQEVRPLVEAARDRLATAFDVRLALPTPRFTWHAPEDLRPETPRTVKRARTVTETVKVSRRTWRRLWLWPSDVEKKVTRNVEEEVYVVSLRQLGNQLADAVQHQLTRMEHEVIQWLEADFRAQIDEYFTDLDDYLSAYRDTLDAALRTRTSEAEAFQEMSDRLKAELAECDAEFARGDRYSETLADVDVSPQAVSSV